MLLLGFEVDEVVQVHFENDKTHVWIKDVKGNQISLNMKNAQQWLNFIVDLEEKIRYAYAEQFELLHDEY